MAPGMSPAGLLAGRNGMAVLEREHSDWHTVRLTSHADLGLGARGAGL